MNLKMKPSCHGSAGNPAFILLEVLVAGVILGIALIALNVAVARCIHGLSVGRQYQSAMEVLDQQMKLQQIGQRGALRQGTDRGEVLRGGIAFQWETETMPTDDPRLFRVVMRVRWKQGDGEREESWETYQWNQG